MKFSILKGKLTENEGLIFFFLLFATIFTEIMWFFSLNSEEHFNIYNYISRVMARKGDSGTSRSFCV